MESIVVMHHWEILMYVL